MLTVDASSVLTFVLTAIAVVFGSVVVVKAAAKYFAVEEAEGYGSRHRNLGAGVCAACGRRGKKTCSRCKSVRYCSRACQSKHWKADHRLKCKQTISSDKIDDVPSRDDASRRKKTSVLGSVSLVPAHGTCRVLQEPKKILFPYDEFLKLFNWDKPGFPPCGLLNSANSCFANVVLQCLACTRPLTAYLLEKDHSRACVRKQEDWCFLCELQAHIQRASKSQKPFSPTNILFQMSNIGGNIGYGSQEDAHEFMRFAIDTMQSVCLDEHGGEKSLDPSTQETTLIQHIFGGHLQSQVMCTKCNTISNRYENMMDLTVEIHGDAESLEECLDQFTIKEWLDGENMYKCDRCNGYVKACKWLTIHQPPNILTIALKRFQSGRFGKLNKKVTFPEELDLTPYIGEIGDGTDIYFLYAVVVHLDMLNASFFGHYICYTKDYYGCWYRIDDCKVIVVDLEEVLSQGAYMLFYSRRTARKEPFVKPTEPARKKQLSLRDVDLSYEKAAKGANALVSLSSNTDSQSNLSLSRDTGHERYTDNDAMEGKDKLEMEDSSLCSLGLKDSEEGSSSLFPHVNVHAQENGSVSITGEVIKLSGCTSEDSITSLNAVSNTIHDMAGSSTGSELKLDPEIAVHYPSTNKVHGLADVSHISEQAIALPPYSENRSMEKLIPHTPGFLAKRNQTEKSQATVLPVLPVLPMGNGHSNGHLVYKCDSNPATLELNGNDTSAIRALRSGTPCSNGEISTTITNVNVCNKEKGWIISKMESIAKLAEDRNSSCEPNFQPSLWSRRYTENKPAEFRKHNGLAAKFVGGGCCRSD